MDTLKWRIKLIAIHYKVLGVVSNMDLAGDELIRWLFERCGKSEQAHGALKNELAGGTLPNCLFGGNAAWWWIAGLFPHLLFAFYCLE